MRHLLAFLFLPILLFSRSFVTQDFLKGKELSEGHRLPMALLFTGSDWSEPSKALIQDIFESALPSEIVCVQVDFPEINRQEPPLIVQNRSLKEQFEIDHLPTVVLLDAQGEEITRLGYPIEDVADFGAHLTKVVRRYALLQKRFKEAQRKKNVGELQMCYGEAKTLGSKALALTILKEGRDIPELILEKYLTLIGTNEGKELRIQLDQVDDKRVGERLALLDFQESQSIEPLERFLEKFEKQSGESLWHIHALIAEFLEEKEEAIEHAQVSHRHAPPEDKPRIEALILKLEETKR